MPRQSRPCTLYTPVDGRLAIESTRASFLGPPSRLPVRKRGLPWGDAPPHLRVRCLLLQILSKTGLLIHAAGQEAAVDGDDLAVDEAGRVRGEEHRRARQLLHVAVAPEGRAQQQLLAPGGVQERAVE